MSEPSELDDILRELRLTRLRASWPELVDRAARESWTSTELLCNLFSGELAARQESRLRRLAVKADFPFHGTIEQFDFRCRPELRRAVFQTYLEDSFVKQGRSLVMIGPPGLGKTHLAVAIGMQAVQRHCDVRCVVTQTLLNRVFGADGPRERERILRIYKKCDLLILDEFGYLLPEPGAGPVLYDIIAARYERRATVITSNKSLTEWGRVVQDEALAEALVDRLMHHGDVFYLRGESYRLKGKERMSLEPQKASKKTQSQLSNRNVTDPEASDE